MLVEADKTDKKEVDAVLALKELVEKINIENKRLISCRKIRDREMEDTISPIMKRSRASTEETKVSKKINSNSKVNSKSKDIKSWVYKSSTPVRNEPCEKTLQSCSKVNVCDLSSSCEKPVEAEPNSMDSNSSSAVRNGENDVMFDSTDACSY